MSDAPAIATTRAFGVDGSCPVAYPERSPRRDRPTPSTRGRLLASCRCPTSPRPSDAPWYGFATTPAVARNRMPVPARRAQADARRRRYDGVDGRGPLDELFTGETTVLRRSGCTFGRLTVPGRSRARARRRRPPEGAIAPGRASITIGSPRLARRRYRTPLDGTSTPMRSHLGHPEAGQTRCPGGVHPADAPDALPGPWLRVDRRGRPSVTARQGETGRRHMAGSPTHWCRSRCRAAVPSTARAGEGARHGNRSSTRSCSQAASVPRHRA